MLGLQTPRITFSSTLFKVLYTCTCNRIEIQMIYVEKLVWKISLNKHNNQQRKLCKCPPLYGRH